MANWSTDKYWFGRLYDLAVAEENRAERAAANGWPIKTISLATLDESFNYHGKFQEMLSRLTWRPTDGGGWDYLIHHIGEVGPSLHISGDGRGGASIPLTKECWEWLKTSVIVYEGHDGFSETWQRSIWIAGEVVYQTELALFPEDDTLAAMAAHEAKDKRWRPYEGRTPEERHFFSRLFPFLNKSRNEQETLA